MACFLVPTAEAIVTTVVKKVSDKKITEENRDKHPFLKRLNRLNAMLWGGSALLAFEHIWHGEIIPTVPFLTAAANPADTAEMLFEMSTSGVAMAALVTIVWAGMVLVENSIEKRDIGLHIQANGGRAK